MYVARDGPPPAVNCSITACVHGVCAEGACRCSADVYGPRCSIQGPPPPTPTAPPLPAIYVSPTGTDSPTCGATSTPCRTLRHALERQFWQGHGTAVFAEVVLMNGSFLGDGNRNLQLHDVPVHLRSQNPGQALVDCSQDSLWGALFIGGASAVTTVTGLTLRKCLVHEQIMQAIASHPDWLAHVARTARWPPDRDGAIYRQNLWLTS